jgi:23S rRNA (guanine1835-N2)-methyltransferase
VIPEVDCQTPFGMFTFVRWPTDHTGTLRAWDGADLLLLDSVSAYLPGPVRRVVVIGDRFGALSISLQDIDPWIVSASATANRAIRGNRSRNGLDAPPRFVSGAISGPELLDVIGGPADLVVWNIERETDTVHHVASLLSSISHESTVVFAAGLDKTLPPKTADILRTVGVVTTHPGRRKAHVFEIRPLEGMNGFAPYVRPEPKPVAVPDFTLSLATGPGVFSAERFDLGTRLLSEHVEIADQIVPDALQIVDLGCGSGALGMLALRALPSASVYFVDESAHAVEASRRNVRSNAATLGVNPEGRSQFLQSDVLADCTDPPFANSDVDLVLCNPPFHHANAINDEIAWQMFVQSYDVLRPGGELWVVSNRHLGYHDKLSRIFEATMQMSSHPKFVVLAARR